MKGKISLCKTSLRKTLMGLAIFITCLGPTVGPALGQSLRNCGPREAIVQRLTQAYGETRQSVGLGKNNDLVEVFASADSGSWTITVTKPSGLTCLVASGQAFETLAEALPDKGKDA